MYNKLNFEPKCFGFNNVFCVNQISSTFNHVEVYEAYQAHQGNQSRILRIWRKNQSLTKWILLFGPSPSSLQSLSQYLLPGQTWKLGWVVAKKQPQVVKIPPHIIHIMDLKLYCEIYLYIQRMLGKRTHFTIFSLYVLT